MEKKFTIQEFKNYILKQDSLGDVLYNLKAVNIEKANEPEEEEEECNHSYGYTSQGPFRASVCNTCGEEI